MIMMVIHDCSNDDYYRDGRDGNKGVNKLRGMKIKIIIIMIM